RRGADAIERDLAPVDGHGLCDERLAVGAQRICEHAKGLCSRILEGRGVLDAEGLDDRLVGDHAPVDAATLDDARADAPHHEPPYSRLAPAPYRPDDPPHA